MQTKTTLGPARFLIIVVAALFFVTAAAIGVGRRRRRRLYLESRPGWQRLQPEPV